MSWNSGPMMSDDEAAKIATATAYLAIRGLVVGSLAGFDMWQVPTELCLLIAGTSKPGPG